MSESNSNVIPAINAVDGFNPADFVRTTVGEEGENDLYLDVKYRLLWFRLHHPNGKIDPELIRVDEKNAIVVDAQELVLRGCHVDKIRLALAAFLVEELVHRLIYRRLL